MSSLSRRDAILLVLLTLAWGLTWPVMKLGVRELPPLYFRMLSVGGGLVILAVYARLASIPLAVAREDRADVVRLAIPNIVVWQIAVILALTLLPAGRSATLGYTMPLWAALIGALWFGEHPSARHWAGVASALLGTALLLSSELTQLAGHPAGTLLMLLAAASWGYGSHMARRRATHLHPLTAIVWMFVVAFLVLLAGSLLFEFDRWRLPSGSQWYAIGYNMAISMAFCHVVWLRLARRLPPAASGLSMMMIPVVGVFSSIWLLGEQPRWQDLVALVLIVGSMATVLLPPGRPTAPVAEEEPLAPRSRSAGDGPGVRVR
jgi:drug/metabolite transporter (DMT)-like permease